MGARQHGAGMGRTRPDHPDLDAGFGRDGGAGGHRRYRQRDQAVPDGGLGIADDALAADQASSSDTGGSSHGSHAVGRMLSLPSAGPAATADRVHSWTR